MTVELPEATLQWGLRSTCNSQPTSQPGVWLPAGMTLRSSDTTAAEVIQFEETNQARNTVAH